MTRVLIDNKNKILFITSPKSGCQHIIVLYKFLVLDNDNINEPRFNEITNNNTVILKPNMYTDYKIFIFFRNPYERLISGYKNKYIKEQNNRYNFKNINYKNLIFEDFINDLVENKFKNINKAHFNLQTDFGSDIDYKYLIKNYNIKFFDISNINYVYLEEIYNKKIPEHILNFKGNHTYEKKDHLDILYNKYVYNIKAKEFIDYKLLDCYFFNKDIKNKVELFYYDDFMFAKNFNYNYEIKNYNNCINNNIEYFSNSLNKNFTSFYFGIFLIFITISLIFIYNKKNKII